MHTRFFLINRPQHAMQKCFFQCERFVSATHVVSFHIRNMPYASGTAIPFGPGLKNLMDLRSNFGRGLENPAGIGFRFTRRIENPAGLRFVFIRGIKNRIKIGFIRPFAWSLVGRIQYAPTLTDENSSGVWFVFIRRSKNRIGINFIRPLAWPFVGRMQYAPTRTDENRAGFWFVFIRGREKGVGRGLCEKWGRCASIIIRRLLPLRARRRMGPIIASAHAFIIPNYVA